MPCYSRFLKYLKVLSFENPIFLGNFKLANNGLTILYGKKMENK